MFEVSAAWMLSWRGWALAVLWDILFLCCFGTLIAVVLGVVFRRSFLWWWASTLMATAVVRSVCIAALDKLSFK